MADATMLSERGRKCIAVSTQIVAASDASVFKGSTFDTEMLVVQDAPT